MAYSGMLTYALVTLGWCAACVSTSGNESSGCTTDVECREGRICDPSGACVDAEGADGGSESGSGDSRGGDDGGSSDSPSADPEGPVDGAPCENAGSDCDEECLINCGAASCVDACCTDTTSTGVMCDGVCREPLCSIGSDADGEESAERPWICYEAEIDGKPFCGCSNYHTEAELEDEGAQIVPSCEGVYCAFYDDEGNVDCQCRGDDESIPLNCHHVPEVGCGLGEVADCDGVPIPTCESPCTPPVYQ